jgi:hypothetical protein
MVRPIGFMFGMIAIALIFFFLVIPGEDQLMDSLVSTGPNITLDAWRELFRYWATLAIGIATLAALIWFALGQWGFGMNHWANANKKRWVWFGLLVVSALAVVPGVLLTPTVQEWGRLAWVFYLANNLAVYYLATLCFSASSFKYQPPLAMRLRYW